MVTKMNVCLYNQTMNVCKQRQNKRSKIFQEHYNLFKHFSTCRKTILKSASQLSCLALEYQKHTLLDRDTIPFLWKPSAPFSDFSLPQPLDSGAGLYNGKVLASLSLKITAWKEVLAEKRGMILQRNPCLARGKDILRCSSVDYGFYS